MSTRARSRIDDLPPYSFPDLELPGVERVVQLAQNELALPPSSLALLAARESLADVNRYSDTSQRDLRRAIAEVYGLDPGNIVCGAGSLELMALLATAYCDHSSEVVVSQYGYKFFQVLCAVAGATIRVVAEPDMRVDPAAIAAAVGADTRLVFLVNPGNPTGLRLAPGEVRALRERLPPEVMLILDGAYAEFVADDNFESGFELVEAGANVVVLRTFSKAYGLAGMRVGWAYAPADVIDSIVKIRPPNSISTPSLAAAEAAVRDRAYLEYVRAEISELRVAFIRHAESLGLIALPSVTNFVLLECPAGFKRSAAELDAGLRQRGVIARPMDAYRLERHLRVSIGSREEMAIAADAFSDLLG